MNSTKSLKTCTNLSARKTRRARISSQSARWFWTSEVILSSSSWRPWSKLRRRRGASLSLIWRWSSSTSNRSSCLWLSPVANFRRKTLRAHSHRPRHSKKSLLSLMIWIGRTVRPCCAYFSPRWTREKLPVAGEMLSQCLILHVVAAQRVPPKAPDLTKTLTAASGTTSTENRSKLKINSSTMMRVTMMKKDLLKAKAPETENDHCQNSLWV